MSDGARVVQRAAAAPQAVASPRPAVRSVPRVQRATLRLSQARDPSEREAEQVARQVMTMPLPVLSPRERVGLLAARAPAATPPPPPRAVPQDEVSPELTAEIKAELGAGQPPSADTRGFLEPRFKASFAVVRIHTDSKAGSIAARLGASAFTFGRDIFFANGSYNPDSAAGMELLAHELTHTIQQREVVQRQLAPTAASAGVLVTQRTAPKVQRGIVSRALDWIADKANNIPGYRMLTVVIGRNPINMAKVDRSGENILRALIEFIPGGHLIVEALENHGVIQKGGKFIEEQFAALGDLGGAIKDALMQFIDSLGWSDVFHLGDLWDRAKRIFTAPVDKAIAFGKNLVGGIASLVKEAIVKPLGRWAANNIPKWNLLVGVFGKNPISDEQESPAYALIGAFMELIGQQEIWENIKKGNAVSRAWTWFQQALKGALALVTSIPGRVMSTLRSLTIFDIVTLVGAFRKVVGAFASFVGDFIRWAGSTVLNLLEIIFSVVAPSVVPYLKKAGSAFSTIIKAPGRFISTLVAAGRQGFNQFKNNIVKHLREALFKWLLGSAEGAGIYFPKSFAPLELLKLGLSVLGLTWANIREKLVAATNETTVKALENGFALVKTLVTEGPAAAWEELLKSLSNLKSMVVDAAIDFVKGEVVRLAIEKLVSFLTPAGAFIQAVIAIYRTISFIVNKLAEIGRLVAAFIDAIAALANGIIAAAADRVESVLATGLSLAISFLANFAGLGNVPKKVMDIIKKIRAPVDKALDKVVGWIVAQAKKVGQFFVTGVRNAVSGGPRSPQETEALVARAQRELPGKIDAFLAREPSKLRTRAQLLIWRAQYGLSSLRLAEAGESAQFVATINPTFSLGGGVTVYVADAQLLGIINSVADEVVSSHPTVVNERRRLRRDAVAAASDSPTLEGRQVRSIVGFASSQRNLRHLTPPRVPTINIGTDDSGNIISVRFRRFSTQKDPNRVVTGPTSGSPIAYSVFAASLGGNPAALLAALRAFATGAPVPSSGMNPQVVGEFYATIVGQETARRPENLVFTIMMVDSIASGATDVAGGIGMHPATRPGLSQKETTGAAQRELASAVEAGGPLRGSENMRDIRARTLAIVTTWIRAQLREGQGPVTKTQRALVLWVRRAVRERMIRFIQTGS